MIRTTLNAQSEDKLKKLLSLYEGKYDKLINEMLTYKRLELKRGINNIENDFKYFEKKYGILTLDFYEKFSNGEYSEHHNDYFKWSGEYEIWKELNLELEKIS